jgi:hypothetical protein
MLMLIRVLACYLLALVLAGLLFNQQMEVIKPLMGSGQ